METSLSYVTISVSDLNKAREYYEGVLRFMPTYNYTPTKWQAYAMGKLSGGFAITECRPYVSPPPTNLVDIFVDDVQSYWVKIKSQVKVIEKLQHTPWGSFKFVIEDPDGNRLGITQRPVLDNNKNL